MRDTTITIINTAILLSCVVWLSPVRAVTWDASGVVFGIHSTLSLSASWRVQKRDESNIAFANSDNLVQVGDPITALRFLQPTLQSNLGNNGLPLPGAYPPGAYAITDPQVCESQGMPVDGLNACWLPYFPSGPGLYNENTDNGNLNFDVGLFSQQYRSVHDIFLDFDNVGFFARVLMFYDAYIEQQNLPHIALTDDAKELVGKDIRMLDRYFYANLYYNDMPVSFRLGNQVISWGESGFISGMNILQNPRDFNQLIMTGGDIKQASIAVESAWVSWGISENLNLEAYIKTQWLPNNLPPAGSYFSQADIVGAGGDLLCINGGMLADDDERRVCVGRTEDKQAKDDGEFGVKLAWYVPELNNTEFGFHYLRYHNPSPVLGAREGIPDITLPQRLQASYYFQYPENLSLFGFTFNTVVPWGMSVAGEISYRKDVPLSVDIYEILGSAVGNLVNILLYDADNGGQLANLLGGGNVDAVQLYSVLTALLPNIVNGPQALDRWLAQQDSSDFRDHPDEGNDCQSQDLCYPHYQIDLMAPFSGADIPAYIERDAIKASMLAIQTFSGDWINASHILMVAEVGALYIMDHPDFDELRLLTPGTEGRGALDPIPSLRGLPCCDRGRWSDAFAWGYALRANAEYNGVLDGFTVSPSIFWQHDVAGTSPTGSAGFVEDNQLLRVGVKFSNQSAADLSVHYTQFRGDAQANKLHDRDFVSMTFNYSF
jgi:hypothetical protein